MTGETDTEIPDTGAVFTFGKSKIANNVPSRLWLKNDIPVHISCGQSHSAFGTEQGRLFVFGSNNSGQLGLQTKGPVTKPTCVKVLKGERVQFVACGTDHTLISTSQGEIFAAGGNSDGQLGLGHCNASISFQRLRPFCDYAPIKLLSAGGHTSAALTEDGRLFMWGDNSVGQLGLGNDSHALLPKELKLGQPIQWVSCGYRHSALVTDNGEVFTFGESADGRLGLSVHQLANHSCPQRVESLHRVLQVVCGGKHTLALTEDELYCFGCGEFGQLGLGTLMFEADAPVAVGHFRKGSVTHVTCGENHSALITDSGLLYTFGDGRHGKLGHGDENFTNQFSPTVCQRLFDYTVMAVACGSSHMLVFARPRQQESEEVCLEDEDVTYSYLDRCYTSMLQGQALEHIPDPAPAQVSQLTFLPSSLPTSHRWSLSTRARRRQRESSSAQFGPEFCSLPPLTTGFTALALTGNILNPDTPKRFRTDAPVESLSTSITLPARTPQFTPITKSTDDCHNVGSSENSMSDKTHEQHTHKMARTSSIGKEVNVPRQSPPTEVLAGSVSHPSMTESPSPSNLKHKKPRSGDPKNLAMQDEHFTATVSQSKMRSKTYKKPIQSTNIKCKGQAVEVRSSPERMSDKEREGCSETCSTYTDSRHKVSKADKYSKVQHADLRGQEVTTLAEMEQETKPSSLEIQKCSPVQEVKQVRTMSTKVQEVKFHQIKDFPVRATKSVKSPVKVQDVPSGRMEVNVVESTLQTDPAKKDIKPSLGKSQEVRLTLVNTQEMGNPTSVKIPAKMQNTAKKGNDKNTVDTEENTGQLTAKKKKKKKSDVERAPMKETAPKIPNPLLVSIPTRMSKAKKRKPVEAENSNVQIKNEMQVQVKSENDSKTLQNSNISFPPIENRKSGGTAKISQSASNLQSEHKNSQSPTDKVLTEQKYEFPSIKSLQPERSHSLSSFQSNNKSAISKSSITKEMESLSGNLLSQSPQHRQLPLNEIKLDGKSVEPEEPDWKPQAEQGIMGSVVSSLPAMAIASSAPLLIKAAEVLSETSPGQNNKMSLCASVSQEIAGNNILPEQEVEQDSTVQDISAIEEIDDSSTKKQSAHNGQSKLVSDENRKTEEEEDVMDSEKEERSEEERLAEKEDENEEAGQKEENSEVEDEEERGIDNDEDSVCAQKGEEDSEEEAKEEESEGTEQKEVNSAVEDEEEREGDNDEDRDSAQKGEEDGEEEEGEEEESEGFGQKEENSAVEDEEERESDDNEDSDSAQKGEEDGEEEEGEGEEEESKGVEQIEENSAVEDEEERESDDNEDSDSAQKGKGDREKEEGEEEESEGVEQIEENSAVEDEEERESDDDEDSDSAQKGEEDREEEEGEEEESEGVEQIEDNIAVDDEEERESDDDDDDDDSYSAQKGEEDREEEEGEEEESEGVEQIEENSAVEDEEERESDDDEDSDSAQKEEEDREEEEGEEEESEALGEEEGDSLSELSSKSEGEKSEEGSGDETERKEEESEDGKMEEEENKDEESGGEDEEEEQESWDEGSEGEVEDEKTDAEEEQEGESSNEEKTVVGEQSDSEDENKNVRSDEEGGESEENDRSEEKEEDNETEEGEQDEKGDEESEEEDEVGYEDEEENQDKKGGVTNSEEEEEEESVKEKEEQKMVEAEDKENISGTRKVDRGDEDDEVDKLNEMMEENNEDESGSEEEEEEEKTDKKEQNIKPDRSGRKQTETNEEAEEETEQKENKIKPEINRRKQKESSEEEEEHEEESEEEEEEEAEPKEMNIKTEKNRRKRIETSEEEEEQEEESEEEEEVEQKEINIKTEKNRRKQIETSEEEEEQEEESEEEEEEEEEEAERKEINIKTEKNRRKQRETSEEEEEHEEESEEEEEVEQKEINIKTEKNKRKQIETSEEEEEQEEESEEEEEEEEEEAERKEINIKTEKNRRKQRETSEEEEEHEEEGEEETEGEEEGEDEGEEEKEEGEEEEEKTNKVPKQRAKPNVLPARRQKNPQRDRQKTRQRHEQNGKGKKQTDDAQDPQFWNSVLPQYLNLK